MCEGCLIPWMLVLAYMWYNVVLSFVSKDRYLNVHLLTLLQYFQYGNADIIPWLVNFTLSNWYLYHFYVVGGQCHQQWYIYGCTYMIQQHGNIVYEVNPLMYDVLLTGRYCLWVFSEMGMGCSYKPWSINGKSTLAWKKSVTTQTSSCTVYFLFTYKHIMVFLYIMALRCYFWRSCTSVKGVSSHFRWVWTLNSRKSPVYTVVHFWLYSRFMAALSTAFSAKDPVVWISELFWLWCLTV